MSSLYSGKSKSHPEQKLGEEFLTNCIPRNFQYIEWESKRKGIRAFDVHDKLVPSCIPVFVSQDEIKKKNFGVDINKKINYSICYEDIKSYALDMDYSKKQVDALLKDEQKMNKIVEMIHAGLQHAFNNGVADTAISEVLGDIL